MKKIIEAINKAQTVLIVGHARPDGDCLGSTFALREYCLSLGKIVDVASPTDLPESYKFVDSSKVFNNITQKKYDLFIAVDCASMERIGRLDGYFRSAKETVNIDHHLNHSGFGKYNLVVNDASSTCELVFDLLSSVIDLTPQIASYLYIGLSTDTGHFMHSNTTPKVLYTAYKLAKAGADVYNIATSIYRTRTPQKTKLIAKAIDGMRMYVDNKVALICITTEMLNACDTNSNETEGLIDYAICLKGVEIGVSMCEEKANDFKVSIWSIDFCIICNKTIGHDLTRPLIDHFIIRLLIAILIIV